MKRILKGLAAGLLGASLALYSCDSPTRYEEKIVEVEVPVPVENRDVYGWVEWEPDGTWPSFNSMLYDEFDDSYILTGLIIRDYMYGFEPGEYLGFQYTWDDNTYHSNDYNWLYPFVPEGRYQADAELIIDDDLYYAISSTFHHSGPDGDTRAPDLFLYYQGTLGKAALPKPVDLQKDALYLFPEVYDAFERDGRLERMRKMNVVRMNGQEETYFRSRAQERSRLEKIVKEGRVSQTGHSERMR